MLLSCSVALTVKPRSNLEALQVGDSSRPIQNELQHGDLSNAWGLGLWLLHVDRRVKGVVDGWSQEMGSWKGVSGHHRWTMTSSSHILSYTEVQ